jgi:hypothetical protein
MGVSQTPVFGPNDHNMAGGALAPGLGELEEQKIRAARGQVAYEEPPDKAALRKQATDLSARAKALSAIERQLEKDRAAMEKEFAAKLAEVQEREALAEAALKELSK